MPLRWVDGFEDNTGWTVAGGSPVVGTSGRTGKCLEMSGSSHDAKVDLTTIGVSVPSDIVTMGVACQVAQIPTGKYELIRIGNSTVINMLQIMTDVGGVIHAGKYNQSVMGSTPTGVFAPGQWFYLEIQVRLADAPNGNYKIAVNGVTHVNLSGVDTLYTGTTVLDQIHFQVGSSGITRYDDFYLATGSLGDPFYGDCRVDTLLPNGNGSVNNWVGSDGNNTDNYQLVDETPPSAADYVASATMGAQDLYTMTDLPPSTGAIKAVCPTIYAQKDEAGVRSIKPLFRRSGVTSAGTALPIDFAMSVRQSQFTSDPQTGTDWLVANVNAMESGVEVA